MVHSSIISKLSEEKLCWFENFWVFVWYLEQVQNEKIVKYHENSKCKYEVACDDKPQKRRKKSRRFSQESPELWMKIPAVKQYHHTVLVLRTKNKNKNNQALNESGV